MIKITQSVGHQGINTPDDVRKIQILINSNLHLLTHINKLEVDGQNGRLTESAIRAYQSKVMKMTHPDGRVDTHGKTLQNLEKTAQQSRPENVRVFIKKVLADAIRVNKKYKVPASVLMAQAALESGWGRHVKNNAYFGIKANRTQGATASFTTTEYIDGKKITITDSFRAYANFGEAAEDYGLFLTTNPRYRPAFVHSNDPHQFAQALQSAGYATDPQYAQKLQSIISTYYLYEYDQ